MCRDVAPQRRLLEQQLQGLELVDRALQLLALLGEQALSVALFCHVLQRVEEPEVARVLRVGTPNTLDRVRGYGSRPDAVCTVLRSSRCSPVGSVVASSIDEQRPSTRGPIWSAQRLVSSFDQPCMPHVSDAL